MRNAKWLFLGAAALLLAALALDAAAQVIIGGKKGPPATLKEGLAAAAKIKAADAERMLKALAPAVAEQLLAGREVELPGLGVLRVVRVAEGKDIDRSGRPVVVPARNYVEFVASGELDKVSNAPGAEPSRTVEPFEFRVNPSATPGLKTDGIKTTRTKPR